MRTRAKSFLKVIFTFTLLSTLLVGCGKENESGGSSGSSNSWNGGVTSVGNGNKLPSDWVKRLENEYRCNTGYSTNNSRQRLGVQVPGQLNLNANALHVGVTLEGDILIMSNKNNRTTVELRACRRPANSSQAQLYTQPVVNVSRVCAIGEITAANVMVQTQYGPYELVFFPIGMSAPSTLCNSY